MLNSGGKKLYIKVSIVYILCLRNYCSSKRFFLFLFLTGHAGAVKSRNQPEHQSSSSQTRGKKLHRSSYFLV